MAYVGNIPVVGPLLTTTGSALNSVASTAAWLTGATLTVTAKGMDVVVDGVANMTGQEGSALHKTAQVGVSLLDVGASMTKMYDLAVGNTATDIATVTASPTIPQTVSQIINGAGPGVDEHSQALVATLANYSQFVVPQNGMTQDEFVSAVFSGAHVVVADEGLQFARWASDENLQWQPRQSSHYQEARHSGTDMMSVVADKVKDKFSPLSETPQLGIDLPRGLGHLLVGRMPESEGGHTFFQLEAHGCSARDFLPHMADFLLHKSSGDAQVGPQGLIHATEKQGTHFVVNPGDPTRL
ncbi:Uncharacterised protein [Bordetella ansorpii]|uniref:Uncharacterized protein n=1 Tax=Bordetella ansorpii TaxID=288768 RepID=A0A157RG48_9BORD|nr:hypothetical protein [Bordetella ansorpii]SAI56906.1 Uncharacterised protein [Bordetella ansorpii]